MIRMSIIFLMYYLLKYVNEKKKFFYGNAHTIEYVYLRQFNSIRPVGTNNAHTTCIQYISINEMIKERNKQKSDKYANLRKQLMRNANFRSTSIIF